MKARTTFCVILMILAVVSTAHCSPEKLLLSVRVSGHGMTWTWALDYVVFLRSDGTFVYTALDGSGPSLHVKPLSKEQTASIVEKAHGIGAVSTQPKNHEFSDCSLDIEIDNDATFETFKAKGVECDLLGFSPRIVDLLCELDAVRGDNKGITAAPNCKHLAVPLPTARPAH